MGCKGSIPSRVKGSTTFFLIPFLPLDRRLFWVSCQNVFRPHIGRHADLANGHVGSMECVLRRSLDRKTRWCRDDWQGFERSDGVDGSVRAEVRITWHQVPLWLTAVANGKCRIGCKLNFRYPCASGHQSSACSPARISILLVKLTCLPDRLTEGTAVGNGMLIQVLTKLRSATLPE